MPTPNSPYDGSNPWGFNPFQPPTTKPHAPALPKPKKRLIPDIDELFSAQNDLVKALRLLTDLEHDNPKLETAGLRKQTENAYRVLNRYLRTWG